MKVGERPPKGSNNMGRVQEDIGVSQSRSGGRICQTGEQEVLNIRAPTFYLVDEDTEVQRG